MKRRQFLQAAGVGLAASAIAKPAIAQSAPVIKWRLTSSFPKSLETLYGAAETLSKYVAEASDNKFQIQIFAAGEVVPALAALDAVSDNKIEMCHTAGYYFVGKDPTFCHYTSIPFGMNARMQNAWFYDGDGMKLLNEFGQKFNLYALVGGNTGTQMGGWFRKEIKEPTDFQGLKFRIGGWAGRTIEKLGGVPQQIAGGDIYQALEKGTIDAAEWVGPHDDEKLGLNRVAKYYYYPAWWEGASALHFFINTSKWNSLPKAYQSILTAAAGLANVEMTARYDARNPVALRKLYSAGAELRPFTEATMAACLKASNEVNAEAAAASADFKKIYESMISFRNAEYLWWQVGDFAYDNFMIRTRSRG